MRTDFPCKIEIAIIGLGLMGGSLAMALKVKCAELLAVVHRESTRELALRMQIVSQADEDPENTATAM